MHDRAWASPRPRRQRVPARVDPGEGGGGAREDVHVQIVTGTTDIRFCRGAGRGDRGGTKEIRACRSGAWPFRGLTAPADRARGGTPHRTVRAVTTTQRRRNPGKGASVLEKTFMSRPEPGHRHSNLVGCGAHGPRRPGGFSRVLPACATVESSLSGSPPAQGRVSESLGPRRQHRPAQVSSPVEDAPPGPGGVSGRGALLGERAGGLVGERGEDQLRGLGEACNRARDAHGIVLVRDPAPSRGAALCFPRPGTPAPPGRVPGESARVLGVRFLWRGEPGPLRHAFLGENCRKTGHDPAGSGRDGDTAFAFASAGTGRPRGPRRAQPHCARPRPTAGRGGPIG